MKEKNSIRKIVFSLFVVHFPPFVYKHTSASAHKAIYRSQRPTKRTFIYLTQMKNIYLQNEKDMLLVWPVTHKPNRNK